MRSASRLLFAITALVAAGACFADDLDSLMSLLAQRKHGHVSFVEEHHLAVLDRPHAA